jgi:hypothetical protein
MAMGQGQGAWGPAWAEGARRWRGGACACVCVCGGGVPVPRVHPTQNWQKPCLDPLSALASPNDAPILGFPQLIPCAAAGIPFVTAANLAAQYCIRVACF